MSRTKTIKLDDEVLAILNRSTFTPTSVTLPKEQLDRALYVKVNKALVAAGGAWDKKSGKHLFDVDPRVSLSLTDAVVVDRRQTLQDFPTPRHVGKQMVDLARISRGMRVLEPSAGRGELAAVILEETGVMPHCVEIDQQLAMGLISRGFPVQCTDFLDVHMPCDFDRVVMNPPFNGNDDARHVMRAFGLLRPGGILVAVIAANTLSKDTAVCKRLRAAFEEHQAAPPIQLPRKTFADTDVATQVITMTCPA
jgi:hypothetical protein